MSIRTCHKCGQQFIATHRCPAERREETAADVNRQKYGDLPDAPQPAVKPARPLSDERIDELIKQHTGGFIGGMHLVHLARAVESELLAARPSAPTAVEPDERTPQDYAIEHAEYMAQSAAHLIACVNDLALAEQQCEDGEADQSDVDAARESVTEAQGHLKSSIYEFRKRRDRASKGTPL